MKESHLKVDKKQEFKFNTQVRGKPMKNFTEQLSESLRNLSDELSYFTINLRIFTDSVAKENIRKTSKLQKLAEQHHQIKVILDKIQEIKSLTLIDQDYSNFCLLIFYGSFMADQLLAMKATDESSVRHANEWKTLAQTFKPFFEKNSEVK